jgi:hypothetical protein
VDRTLKFLQADFPHKETLSRWFKLLHVRVLATVCEAGSSVCRNMYDPTHAEAMFSPSEIMRQGDSLDRVRSMLYKKETIGVEERGQGFLVACWSPNGTRNRATRARPKFGNYTTSSLFDSTRHLFLLLL